MRQKEELLRGLGVAVRQLGVQSVLSSAAMAKRFGLHTTDLEVLDLIFIRQTASAGELAKATGLTSGATTALIDRLEERGYVTREADPGDRRKTLVRVNRNATATIEAAYAPQQALMFELWSKYDNTALELFCEFLDQSTALLVRRTQDIKSDEP